MYNTLSARRMIKLKLEVNLKLSVVGDFLMSLLRKGKMNLSSYLGFFVYYIAD